MFVQLPVVYTSDGHIFIFYQFFSLFILSQEEKMKLSTKTKTQKSSKKTYSSMCTKNYWLIDVWLDNFNHLGHFSLFSHQHQTLLIEFFAELKRVWFWIGITNLWMMPGPTRATQNHPEQTGASQSHPRTTQSQLEPARASQ